jgi:hypothetical protein
LIKYCDDDHEKQTLEKASTKMQEVVAKMNEDKRIAENREKLNEIQSRFSDKVLLL